MWIFIVHALFRHFLARYVSPHPSFYKNKSYLKGEIKIRARVLAKSISLRLCITEVYRAYNVEKRKTKFTPIRNPGEIIHNDWSLPSYVLLVFRILYSTFSMCWLLTAVSKDRLKLFAGVFADGALYFFVQELIFPFDKFLLVSWRNLHKKAAT